VQFSTWSSFIHRTVRTRAVFLLGRKRKRRRRRMIRKRRRIIRRRRIRMKKNDQKKTKKKKKKKNGAWLLYKTLVCLVTIGVTNEDGDD
jgi:hypothetical protein